MTSHRTSRAAMRNALTGALSFVLLTACTTGDKPAASNVSAAQAKQMLADGQTNAAVASAEAAVLASPRDADYRATLGQAYLRAGRFEAAATSFEDARTLGDTSGRTALSLALAMIGGGEGQDALQILAQNRNVIPAGDLGLAVSLAGDPRGGVAILTDALRNGENTAKVRQNLAYSYALAGKWREARVMASEDVPANQVGERMAQWAETARPDLARHRVAALIDAPVVADPGQPQRLALANSVDPVQFAQVDAVVQPVAEPVVEAVAVVEPKAEPVAMAAVEPAGPRYVSNAVVQRIPERAAPRQAEAAAPRAVQVAKAEAPRAVAKPAPVKASSGDTHLVQLGSFTSRERAEKAWNIYVSRNPQLKDFEKVITAAVVRGTTYYRVQAAGFDRAGANAMCGTVAKNGEGCLAMADARGAERSVGLAMRARR